MAFSSVHGFEPKPFQVDAAAHILHCAAVNGNGATGGLRDVDERPIINQEVVVTLVYPFSKLLKSH
jgi:hypothetical protein